MELGTSTKNSAGTGGKGRIEWIDALRGFTMILVVFGHIELIGFDMPKSTVNNIIYSFHVPLFFFLSGFLAFKANRKWDWGAYKNLILKKIKQIFIPTIILGLLFSITVFSHRYGEETLDSIMMFFSDPSKLGYWFTVTLFFVFFIYYTVSLLLAKGKESTRHIVFAVMAIGMFLLSLLGSSFYYDNTVASCLSLYHVLLYFQFFVFGTIFACYQDKLFRLIENQYVIGVVILLFVGLFVGNCLLGESSLSSTVYGKVGSKAIAEVLRYLGIVSMLAIFKHYRGALSSNKKVGRGLQYVGKLTLDIYLLHYFFLPNLPTLGEFFMGVENTALELVVSGALAMLVVVLCLIVSKVIRTSPFLAQYLLGESNKKKKMNQNN